MSGTPSPSSEENRQEDEILAHTDILQHSHIQLPWTLFRLFIPHTMFHTGYGGNQTPARCILQHHRFPCRQYNQNRHRYSSVLSCSPDNISGRNVKESLIHIIEGPLLLIANPGFVESGSYMPEADVLSLFFPLNANTAGYRPEYYCFHIKRLQWIFSYGRDKNR